MITPRVVRYVWASPKTALGLALATLAVALGRVSIVDGVVEVHGPGLGWVLTRLVPLRGGALAITLGHVGLGRDAHVLRATREHERVHVAQCERWGPFFTPAHLAASAWALVRVRHSYFDNVFEREALEAERAPQSAVLRVARR
jgi:hypothetical protein